MHDVSLQKKNKICLEDYDFRKDIENRLLMGQFSSLDLEVLEEILYSSLTISTRKLAKSVDIEEETLLQILEKLSKSGLFTVAKDTITVDKEMRKYFEAQILKFDPDFKPGMEFLQTLLRKVPIHILPTWYSIPRTSNNIFESLVEKYFLTPQIFQRYLMDLNFSNPVLQSIVKDVYSAPHFTVLGKDLIAKYNLTKEQFEEHLLYLEFHFVCCLGYKKVDDHWEEIVTPFQEWHEYLLFLKQTEPHPISDPKSISRLRDDDFAFTQDVTLLLKTIKEQPVPFPLEPKTEKSLHSKLHLKDSPLPEEKNWIDSYIPRLISKARTLRLADVVDGRLYALEGANDWLEMKKEAQALFLYKHPLNKVDDPKVPSHLYTDRNIKEAEKSIQRALNLGWVYLDDLIKATIVPLGEDSLVMLKKQGKTWKYCLPSYSEEEIELIKAVVFDWLFEMGATSIGLHQGKQCFTLTAFGQSLFGR